MEGTDVGVDEEARMGRVEGSTQGGLRLAMVTGR